MNVDNVKASELAALQAASAESLTAQPDMSAADVKHFLSFFMNAGAQSPLIALIDRIVDQINDAHEVLFDSDPPDLHTEGYVGQLFKDTGSSPNAYYVCTGEDGGVYIWERLLVRDIESIVLDGSVGLVDTYKIIFTDGTFRTFTVENGNGISRIDKTATDGLTDTYTIYYTDGSRQTYTVKNGKSISSIAKVGTVGLVDTYRITYNDGTNFEYNVTNGDSSAANAAAESAIAAATTALSAASSANSAASDARDAKASAEYAARAAISAASDADDATSAANAAASAANAAASDADDAASAANAAASAANAAAAAAEAAKDSLVNVIQDEYPVNPDAQHCFSARVTDEALRTVVAQVTGDAVDESFALTDGKLYYMSYTTVGQSIDNALKNNTHGKYCLIDVEENAGGSLVLKIPSMTSNETASYGFADINKNCIERYKTNSAHFTFDSEQSVYKSAKYRIPSNAKYLYFSVYVGSGPLTVEMYYKRIADYPTVFWVAPNGDDGNDGLTASTPKASVNSALINGAKIINLAGGVYAQQIDLSKAKDYLKIAPAEPDQKPVFLATDSLLCSSETLTDGYTKVYQAACNKNLVTDNIYIFQDDVSDESTLIPREERHPLQRGKRCRCDDTAIVHTTATTLSDALAEIEGATTYKWFLDTTNQILYFSRPQEVTASYPIRGSFGKKFFVNGNRSLSLDITGITVKYQAFDLTGVTSAKITDCACMNVYSPGAFLWNRGIGTTFCRCEAARCYYSTTTGDGFNAHSENTGDAFAKQTTCTLLDCWSHDNVDDGYSDHERCEITLYGGLYEHNGGAGVTPAKGSHCTCYNVCSQYNSEADFYYTGGPVQSEGGVGGQIVCIGCLSIGGGTGTGYRLNGDEIKGLFVNCICMNRGRAFRSDAGRETMIGMIVNCSTVNCTEIKDAGFTAYAGTVIS